MHHGSLLRCLAALGLSACTRPAASVDVAPEPLEREGERAGEPSGLGDPAIVPTTEQPTHFEIPSTAWCDVQLDPRARKLEPTASFLEAWNLALERSQPSTRYNPAPPQSELEARARACGSTCEAAEPRVLRAEQRNNVSIAALLPTTGGFWVLPVPGGQSSCVFEPTLSVERVGGLLHARVSVSDGEPERMYFHGHYDYHQDKRHRPYVPYGGECRPGQVTRSDLIIDVEHGVLALTLTQTRTADAPMVEVELREQIVTLSGCNDRLELRWTGFP